MGAQWCMAHSVAMSRESAEPTSESETTSDEPSGEEETTSDEPSGKDETTKQEDDGVPTSKQRRATAKRKLERQLERRAQQARRRRILTIGALAAVVIVVVGAVAWLVFFKKDNASSTAASPSSTAPPAPDTPPPADVGVLPPFKPPADLGANCTYPPTPEPAAKKVDPPRGGKVPTTPAEISMSITTNQGPLGVHLNNAQAPCTVNSFASLAQKGYFTDTHCHRLTTGKLSVLQCGDPGGDGKGGPGYQFANEYPTNQYVPDDPALNNAVIYPRGTLAMANGGPNTNGSQFFLVYKDSPLPPNYTVFGTVDQKDLGTLDKIAAAGTADGSPDGKPKMDVVITSARVD
jgi:peptidyl-prolyl cis-trans isomerase B (cyclophilin B)